MLHLPKKLSPLFYYLILLFQLSNPENFEEFKAQEVLKIRKEKKQESHQLRLFASVMAVKNKSRQLCTLFELSAYAYGIFKV